MPAGTVNFTFDRSDYRHESCQAVIPWIPITSDNHQSSCLAVSSLLSEIAGCGRPSGRKWNCRLVWIHSQRCNTHRPDPHGSSENVRAGQVTPGIPTRCSSRSTLYCIVFGGPWTRRETPLTFWCRSAVTRPQPNGFSVTIEGPAPTAMVNDYRPTAALFRCASGDNASGYTQH